MKAAIWIAAVALLLAGSVAAYACTTHAPSCVYSNGVTVCS